MRLAACVLLSIAATVELAAIVGAAEPPGQVERQGGALRMTVGGAPLLEYQAAQVEPPAGLLEQIAPGVRKYAVARACYLHPLFGPHDETLTADWNHDHPHHRGVYWAWPEVQFRGELKDLHALQGISTRAAGEPEIRSGADFAEIRVQNHWLWNDKTPIVSERVTIRGQADGGTGRYVDLTIELTAPTDGVTIARRGTKLYGGLNIRLAKVQGLTLRHHADAPADESKPANRQPRMAWQYASGVWRGARQPATWVVLESAQNPGYPGDYIEYANLPWFQPTFPRAGQRYALHRGEPLTLRYRFWIIPGAAPAEDVLRREWTKFHSSSPGRAEGNVPAAAESSVPTHHPTKVLP